MFGRSCTGNRSNLSSLGDSIASTPSDEDKVFAGNFFNHLNSEVSKLSTRLSDGYCENGIWSDSDSGLGMGLPDPSNGFSNFTSTATQSRSHGCMKYEQRKDMLRSTSLDAQPSTPRQNVQPTSWLPVTSVPTYAPMSEIQRIYAPSGSSPLKNATPSQPQLNCWTPNTVACPSNGNHLLNDKHQCLWSVPTTPTRRLSNSNADPGAGFMGLAGCKSVLSGDITHPYTMNGTSKFKNLLSRDRISDSSQKISSSEEKVLKRTSNDHKPVSCENGRVNAGPLTDFINRNKVAPPPDESRDWTDGTSSARRNVNIDRDWIDGTSSARRKLKFDQNSNENVDFDMKAVARTVHNGVNYDNTVSTGRAREMETLRDVNIPKQCELIFNHFHFESDSEILSPPRPFKSTESPASPVHILSPPHNFKPEPLTTLGSPNPTLNGIGDTQIDKRIIISESARQKQNIPAKAGINSNFERERSNQMSNGISKSSVPLVQRSVSDSYSATATAQRRLLPTVPEVGGGICLPVQHDRRDAAFHEQHFSETEAATLPRRSTKGNVVIITENLEKEIPRSKVRRPWSNFGFGKKKSESGSSSSIQNGAQSARSQESIPLEDFLRLPVRGKKINTEPSSVSNVSKPRTIGSTQSLQEANSKSISFESDPVPKQNVTCLRSRSVIENTSSSDGCQEHAASSSTLYGTLKSKFKTSSKSGSLPLDRPPISKPRPTSKLVRTDVDKTQRADYLPKSKSFSKSARDRFSVSSVLDIFGSQKKHPTFGTFLEDSKRVHWEDDGTIGSEISDNGKATGHKTRSKTPLVFSGGGISTGVCFATSPEHNSARRNQRLTSFPEASSSFTTSKQTDSLKSSSTSSLVINKRMLPNVPENSTTGMKHPENGRSYDAKILERLTEVELSRKRSEILSNANQTMDNLFQDLDGSISTSGSAQDIPTILADVFEGRKAELLSASKRFVVDCRQLIANAPLLPIDGVNNDVAVTLTSFANLIHCGVAMVDCLSLPDHKSTLVGQLREVGSGYSRTVEAVVNGAGRKLDMVSLMEHTSVVLGAISALIVWLNSLDFNKLPIRF